MVAAPSRPRAVLIGSMGAGKSTVGRLLAERWGVGFRDTDADVEAIAGKPVQDIFVDDGEPAFRALEREAVAAALSDHDGVLSLGGGAVLAEETRRRLVGHQVVFLEVGLSDAVRRVGLADGRPVLNQAVGGIRSRIKALLEERNPIYESVATMRIETDGRTAHEVTEEIIKRMEEA